MQGVRRENEETVGRRMSCGNKASQKMRDELSALIRRHAAHPDARVALISAFATALVALLQSIGADRDKSVESFVKTWDEIARNGETVQ
jgi:predicted secreted protein